MIDRADRATVLGGHRRGDALRARAPGEAAGDRGTLGDDGRRDRPARRQTRLCCSRRRRLRLLHLGPVDRHRPRPARAAPSDERRQVRLRRSPVGGEHPHGVRPGRRRLAPVGRGLAQRHPRRRLHPSQRAGLGSGRHQDVPHRQHDQLPAERRLRRRRGPHRRVRPALPNRARGCPTASPSTSMAASGWRCGLVRRCAVSTGPAAHWDRSDAGDSAVQLRVRT